MTLYIGLMSGTSMDGVDGVLVDFGADARSGLHVLTDAHVAMPPALGAELLALNSSGADELQRAALAANALARLQAEVVAHLLNQADIDADVVRAVGSHGQTVRHRPGEFDGTGFTLQLNNGALLAEACGIDVVCDFRSRDIAAGGQGAPLVPAFHRDVFGSATPRAILNIGGIANLTLLPSTDDPSAGLAGFDTGPGNALMDHWCRLHTDAPYDDDGRWAASGRVDGMLLVELMADAYFRKAPPKSTGRDLFNPAWLAQALARAGGTRAPADVQATLLELTARTAIDALRASASATRELLVCGGGARNGALMARLAALWPGLTVAPTDTTGLPATQVEAAAFAWLARQFCERRPGNHPGVTGAAGLRMLGALYPH
ncbi:anhydro-N-acetylmuramic acid kinase [Scleromatobacter humisilvae]|uniref:Anhydro-N-acetylmuramic acid kinase n=1 Tax=Scleromatobacter humisilvae TaxID=2897159 RepID=A0A9X1YNP2_9BURK|nr:anhydro-N-acetylmuramic acid kinase [Scleromatobacter humisilvae]MCK9684906.1 anhydro-N-acetylmuramic acid kinase [Scleromatobacter humisilvae]